MPLVNLTDLARQRASTHQGLGAFNVIHLEHAETFIAAAERVGQPVALQISENAVKYHRGLAPIAAGSIAAARAATVPVVVHLDHAESVTLINEALQLGFTSVMYDGAKLPFDQNVATTIDVVGKAHALGVSVEAELGEVGGKDGAHAPGARTDPDEAARFVAQTGVDLLAVAVGSSHAMTDRNAALDTDLISQLAEAVPVPLVLHGSSGVSDDGIRAAITAGITKVNVSTHLNGILTRSIRATLAASATLVDPRKYLGPAMDAVGAEVERLLVWYAGGSDAPVSAGVTEPANTRTVAVGSSQGLHARPAGLVAKAAAEASSPVTIGRPEQAPVDASSLLMIMTLGLAAGESVTITSEDSAALAAIAELVATDMDA